MEAFLKLSKFILCTFFIVHSAFADDPAVLEGSSSSWEAGMGFLGPATSMRMGLGAPLNPDGQKNKTPTSIKVKFHDSAAPQTCNLDKVSSNYFCPNSGQPIFIKHSYMGFGAIGSGKDGPEPKGISSVEIDGKTIFEAPKMAKFPTPKDLGSVFFEKVSAVESFFGDERALKGSPEYKKAAESLIAEKNKLKQKAQSVFQETSYQVELTNDQKINCARGNTRPLTTDEVAYEKNYGQKIMCGAFQCDEVTVDGKKYRATMLYDSNPGSFIVGSIHLIDGNGIGPKVDIKKVFSPNSELPLLDKNPAPGTNPFKNYYAEQIKKAIPESVPERDKIIDYKSPGFDEVLQTFQNICGQDNTALKDLTEAKRKLMLNLADAKLAEFIQVLADGRLYGFYMDPNKAVAMGCNYEGVYLDPEAAKHLDRLKKNIHPDKNVAEAITMDRANQLFKKATNMKDIAWKYKPDGCYARAHLMARRFEAEGVRVDKVWIKGDLYVPGTQIRWNFHVAPIVYVKNEQGKIQKMVIDPSLFDKPVTVEEWDNKMSKNTARGSSITAFPFPENAALMERSALAFSSSDPYLPGDNIHMTEESKMQQANQTMKQYKQMEPK